jgi:hypothetical protein
VADSLYLSPERSGVRWLLDPATPELAGLAHAVQSRTEGTECEPQAVAADLSMLPQLVRERHFGIATGLVARKAADQAEQLILEARDRVLSERPQSWGEALADLNDQLRICLRDRHVALRGSGQSRIRSDEPVAAVDQNAPAVEVVVDLRAGRCADPRHVSRVVRRGGTTRPVELSRPDRGTRRP